MRPTRTERAATVPAFLLVLTTVLAASPASALPSDHRAPTRPNQLRITAVGSYSVSLSWNASSDDSGFLSYVITASNGYTMTVPQSSTTATWVGGGIYPLNQYTWSVRAVDAAGNSSNNSNSVRATLPADTTMPSTPTVTVTDVGPHHASFSWSSTDNDPYLSYFVYINGTQIGHSSTLTSGTFYLPQANTSYTITVKARDHAMHFSTSAPVTITSDPIDTSDTQPPTTPAALDAYSNGDLELFLTWTQSTDNVDARQAIHYEIYINGVLAEHVIGVGGTSSYGEPGSNVISIIAIDSAGNESAPRTITTEIF